MRRKSKRINKKHFTKYFSHKSKSKIQPKPLTTSPPEEKPKRILKQLDRNDIIHGMSILIHKYIQKNEHHSTGFPGPRLFNSTEIPIPTPCSFEQIQKFIQSIYDKRDALHVESGIIALILLNRTHIKIHSRNWMRLVLISLLLANKHCEDVYSVYNAKFVGLIPNLENLEINILELEFLKFIRYRLHIETETYDEFYTRLQKLFPVKNSARTIPGFSVKNSAGLSLPVSELQSNGDYNEICAVMDTCDSTWQDCNFALVDSIAWTYLIVLKMI